MIIKKTSILVTGAAGFIGSQLSYKFIKGGADVVMIDNFSYGKEDNLIFDDMDLRTKVLHIDIRSSAIYNLFKEHQFDYVYNIAGIAPLPDCQSNPVEAVDVNVNGLVNILEAARMTGVKCVIQASTNAMYENVETFPTEEEFKELPTLIYPNTKYCAEQFARSYAETYGMNVCCVRFANVYGPHVDCMRKQPPFVAYLVRELFYNRQPVFHSDGNQSRDYIYVDDLTDLLDKVCTTKGFQAVNCSSGISYSVNEIYGLAQQIMNKNIEATYTSANNYWKKYPELYEGAYSIKPEILEHEVNKYSKCSNKKAKLLYGWVPQVSMYEGLMRMIEYQVKLLENKNEK